jgi:hypothetical protein
LARTYGYELTTPGAPAMTLRIRNADKPRNVLAERTFSPTVLPPLKMSVRPRLSYLSERRIGADFEINLGRRLPQRSELTVAVLGPKGQTTLRSMTVPVEGSRLTAQIDLQGLPEGVYRVRARLCTGGAALGEVEASIERLRGPFD